MIDFTTIDYLKDGNERQSKAFEVLTKYKIFEKLSNFSPILAGTIPIEIDIEGSDLDIICEVKDKVEFKKLLKEIFDHSTNFKIREDVINDEDCIILNVFINDFEIEIFGQNKPTILQNAYLHMIAEYKILKEKGEDFKQKIIDLKKKGIKTEPAFGMLLNLENPYQDLLKF